MNDGPSKNLVKLRRPSRNKRISLVRMIMPTVLPVLSQHSEQCSCLCGTRVGAATSPHYNFADLAKLDLRIEANLDGLRIASEEGWQLCAKELDWEEPGEVFAAAVLALENGDDSKIQSVLKAATKTPELAGGFISALGWLEYRQAEPHIKTLCGSHASAERRVGIAAAAIHRKDPGRVLNDGVSDPDPLLRARALRAVGELGRTDLVPLIQNELNAQTRDEGCRFWAAWSTTLLVGYGNAIRALQSVAESPSPYRERALQMALRRMDIASAHSWQQRLVTDRLEKSPHAARLAVIGAGVIGDPALVPWLTEQMKVAPLARVAGEAFTMITGVDIAYEDLDTDKPEGFESGPTENPEDDNVEMDPDERLPWPDANLIAKWWEKHANEFQPGARHLLGKPITIDWMQQVLRVGRQRQRAAAALELAIMQPGVPLFEVRAPGFRQQELLQISARR
jgi:uncharacterized protein (TIGR02270 family)